MCLLANEKALGVSAVGKGRGVLLVVRALSLNAVFCEELNSLKVLGIDLGEEAFFGRGEEGGVVFEHSREGQGVMQASQGVIQGNAIGTGGNVQGEVGGEGTPKCLGGEVSQGGVKGLVFAGDVDAEEEEAEVEGEAG